MCPELPIDVVYTWVNGSDPVLLSQLRRLKAQTEKCVSHRSYTLHFSHSPLPLYGHMHIAGAIDGTQTYMYMYVHVHNYIHVHIHITHPNESVSYDRGHSIIMQAMVDL